MSATPEAALGQVLDNAAAVTAIRGDDLYAGPVPKGVNPYQVVRRVDRPYAGHMEGIARQAVARVQLDTYSTDAEEAERLAEISKLVLLTFGRGTVTLGTESISDIGFRIIDDDSEDILVKDGSDTKSIRHVRQDYSVPHTVDN